MPRRLKNRPLTASRSDWLKSYLAVRAMPFPHSPELLQHIVMALLFRLKHKDPIGTRDLEILINDMAARERHFEHFQSWYNEENSWDKTKAVMDTMVRVLAGGRTSTRASHYQGILQRQKDIFFAGS